MATVTQFRRRRRGPLLGVEFLERRLALTGSVTAMVVGSGDLLIQGDLADNAIAVTLRDEQISVASLDGSTVINGGTEALFDPAELTGDLRIALGAGVNSLRVGGETHETEEIATAGSPGGCSGEDDHDEPRLTVPGDLLILGGGETDTVAISFVEIGGRLSIHSLAGDDTITVGRGPGFGHDDHGEEHLAATVSEASENTGTGCDDDEGGGGPPPDVRVAGDFFVIGGPGNDRLKVAFAEIGGGMRLMTGPGEDTVVTGRGPIQGVHGPGEDGDCGGEDHDGGHSGGCEGHEDPSVDPPHVAASGATAMGDSDCAGGDTSHPGGGVGDAGGGPHRRPVDVAIGLDFRIDLGPGDDFAMLRNAKVGGSLDASSGPGDDALGAQNLRVHEDAVIRTLAGDDIVAIWQSTIHGLFDVSTGSGNDLVLIAETMAKGPLQLDVGSQDDTVLLTSTTLLGPVVLSGGPGNDAVMETDLTVMHSFLRTEFEEYQLDEEVLARVFEEIDDIFGGFLMGRGQIV